MDHDPKKRNASPIDEKDMSADPGSSSIFLERRPIKRPRDTTLKHPQQPEGDPLQLEGDPQQLEGDHRLSERVIRMVSAVISREIGCVDDKVKDIVQVHPRRLIPLISRYWDEADNKVLDLLVAEISKDDFIA
jgi:hypothetical protein